MGRSELHAMPKVHFDVEPCSHEHVLKCTSHDILCEHFPKKPTSKKNEILGDNMSFDYFGEWLYDVEFVNGADAQVVDL